jgi:hypothetical protein
MDWYVYVARFFAGVFLANAVPHFVSGIQGRRFPTPFASPPGRGESSPTLNVVWGTANAVVGYALLYHVGTFSVIQWREVGLVFLGGFLMGLRLSNVFGRMYAGVPATETLRHRDS